MTTPDRLILYLDTAVILFGILYVLFDYLGRKR